MSGRESAAAKVAALAEPPVAPAAPEPQFVTLIQAQQMAADAAATAVESVVARLQSESGKPATFGAEMQGFVEGLAKAIAEVGNQGTGKTVIDPAVLAKRAKAREKMVEHIIVARQAGITPRYMLTAKVYLGDRLIEPVWTDNQRVEHRQVVKWNSVPNECMVPAEPENEGERPACEAAKRIHDAFCESIGKTPGTIARVLPFGTHGNLASPKGNVFQALAPIPKDYGYNQVGVEGGVVSDVPPTGLEVIGGAANGHQRKTVSIPVLGTVAAPAVQQVA